MELFDPRGKNSGSVNGKEYFKCPDQHGLFLRSTQIQVREERGRVAHWLLKLTGLLSFSVLCVCVFSVLQVVVDHPPLGEPRVGARVWLRDKDFYGFVR